MAEGLKMKYFVLTPTKRDPYGEASRAAIRAYSRCIEEENFTLAKDLNHWLDALQETEFLEKINATRGGLDIPLDPPPPPPGHKVP